MKDRFRFRVWIEKYKKLVDVYRYGNDAGVCQWVWHSHIYDTPDGKPVIDNWGSVDERFSNIIEKTKLIDCILEQCTGLKDKNGKLIYEGDILGYFDNKIAVVYDNESPSFRLCGLDGSHYGHLSQEYVDSFGFKIIGNIHEKESK